MVSVVTYEPRAMPTLPPVTVKLTLEKLRFFSVPSLSICAMKPTFCEALQSKVMLRTEWLPPS